MSTRIFRLFTLCVTLLGCAGPLAAAGLADISNKDAVAGLKEALARGSQAAVQRLASKTDSSAPSGADARDDRASLEIHPRSSTWPGHIVERGANDVCRLAHAGAR